MKVANYMKSRVVITLMYRFVLVCVVIASASGGCLLRGATDNFFCNEVLVKSLSHAPKSHNAQTFFDHDKPEWHSLERLLKSYAPPEQKPITVMVLSRNNARYYKSNLSSIFAQQYDNYRVIYVDDASTDGTGPLVSDYIQQKKQSHRCSIVVHGERQYALSGNLEVFELADPESIIIGVDGDDALLTPRAFELINKVYCLGDPVHKKHREAWFASLGIDPQKIGIPDEVWIACGNYIDFVFLKRQLPIRFPQWVIEKNMYRKFFMRAVYHAMAPRTFYCWLARAIDSRALLYHGSLPTVSNDVALMLSLFELAGGRFFYINDVLYGYNLTTGYNDATLNRSHQKEVGLYYRQNVMPLSPLKPCIVI